MAKQRPFELAYPVEWYTPYGIANLTDKQLRDEYTRMRDAAQKRVKRLATSEFSTSQAARQYGRGFAKLGTLTVRPPKAAGPEERAIAQQATRKSIEAEFMRMSVFLRSPEVSVAGLRERRAHNIKLLREHGYSVNTRNYNKFVKFMERMREKYGSKIFDSDQAADIFSAGERAHLSPEQLENMVERYHEGGEEGAQQVHDIILLRDPRKIREAYAAAFESVHGK